MRTTDAPYLVFRRFEDANLITCKQIYYRCQPEMNAECLNVVLTSINVHRLEFLLLAVEALVNDACTTT